MGAITGIVIADGGGNIAAATIGTGIVFEGSAIKNDDLGSVAVASHTGVYNHDLFTSFGTEVATAVVNDRYITITVGTAVYGINVQRL